MHNLKRVAIYGMTKMKSPMEGQLSTESLVLASRESRDKGEQKKHLAPN